MIWIDILVWIVLILPYVLIIGLGIHVENLNRNIRKYKNMVDVYYKCASGHFKRTYERLDIIERNIK